MRAHASTRHWVAEGPERAAGRGATGRLTEQALQSTDEQGEGLKLRRITLHLERPTRDGDRGSVGLSTLPAAVPAAALADLYRERWDIEGAFQELTMILQGEPNT